MNWQLHIGADFWGIAAAAVAMARCAFAAYRGRNEYLRPGSRALPAANILAFASLCAISFLLLKPEIVFSRKDGRLPRMAVLRDVSGSMGTRDVDSAGGMQTRSDWVDSFFAGDAFSSLGSAYEIVKRDFSGTDSNPDPQGGTDIGSALGALKNEDFDEVILISDGLQTTGPSPVRAAAELALGAARIHCICTGSDRAMPDIELGGAAVPGYCMLQEQLSIPYAVTNKFEREMNVAVRFKCDDGASDHVETRLGAGEVRRGSFLWKPSRKGSFKISLSAERQKGESDLANNDFAAGIEVRDDKLKVLLADSVPRWEFRYIKNALCRDPGVEAHFMLFHPELGIADGNGYRQKFPDRDEMGSFDVFFIGDIGTKELSSADLESLRRAVSEDAAGLVIIPGRRGAFTSLEKSPLADLLPVKSDPANPGGMKTGTEAPVELTGYGASHHLTMLEDSASANAILWRSLPGVTWSWAVLETMPGSRVMAVHSHLRNKEGRTPMLVEKSHGSGIVLFMGTDHIWKWRKAVEDKYHYRFWSQVIRWMSHKRHLGAGEKARIFHEPETPAPGEETTVKAFLSEKTPPDIEDLLMTVEPEDGSSSSAFPMERDASAPRQYSARFTPRRGGVLSLSLKSGSLGEIATMQIRVSPGRREKTGEAADPAMMKSIAKAGGGIASPAGDANSLLQKLSSSRKDIVEEKRLRIWDSPWSIATLIAMLSISWILRKAAGRI